jgi:hypothetical protein
MSSTIELPGSRLPGRLLTLAGLLGYALVGVSIAAAWSARERNLIRAEDGLGYALGIIGASLMLLLLVYPLRKRVRSLGALGSIRFWFRTHMIFGILGPLLILLHSNFVLGSLNSRIALFCTLIVASSGIIGRHLYAKIHYGMYGQRATLASLRADIAAISATATRGLRFGQLIDERLAPLERRILERSQKVLPSLLDALCAPLVAWRLQRALVLALRAELDNFGSALAADTRIRLLDSANRALSKRLGAYRKLAQLSGCERLFSLWHIVHFPLFLVMVLAAIVHVIAVHAY